MNNIQFNSVNSIFAPRRAFQNHAPLIAIALAILGALGLLYTLCYKRGIAATPIIPKASTPVIPTPPHAQAPIPKNDVTPDFNKLKNEIVIEIDKTLQEKIDAAIKQKIDEAIAAAKHELREDHNKLREGISADVTKKLSEIPSPIPIINSAIGAAKHELREEINADVNKKLSEISTRAPTPIPEKENTSTPAVAQPIEKEERNNEPQKKIEKLPPAETTKSRSETYNFDERVILSSTNQQLLQEFNAKEINFHFDNPNQNYVICQEVLLNLPKKDYIILSHPNPRVVEVAKHENCQKFLKKIEKPVVIGFNQSVLTGDAYVQLVTFQDIHDKRLKDCYYLSLLTTSSKRSFSSIQEANEKAIQRLNDKFAQGNMNL